MGLILREYIPFITMLSLYSLIGISGNVLILIVYCRERVKLCHTLFIKLLSALDLLVCAILIPYSIMFELHFIQNDFICRLVELVRHAVVIYSNFILLAIAVERYFAVCKPMKKLRYDQLRLTLIIGLIICVGCAVPVTTIFGVCRTDECLDKPVTGSGKSLTGSDVTITIATETAMQAVEEEAFCQFTTTTLGRVGTDVYQGFLLLVFCLGLIIISIIYPMVYRVALSRSHWRRNRVGVIRISDLELDMANSKKVFVKTQEGKKFSCKSDNVTQGPSTIPVSSVDIFGSKYLQVRPVCSTSVRKDKGTTKGMRKRGTGTGTMLFVCTFIFLLVWVPFWIDVFTVIENLTFRYMFLAGHVINPIVYGIMSKEVRTEIWTLFSCRKSNA